MGLTSFYIRSLDHLHIKNKKARNKPKKTRCKKKKLQPGTVHKIVCLWSQLFFDEEEKNSTFYFTPGLKTSFKKKVSPTLVKQKKVASSGRNWASIGLLCKIVFYFPPQWIMRAHCDLSGVGFFYTLRLYKVQLGLGAGAWGTPERQPPVWENEAVGNMSSSVWNWRSLR